jgi:hypothetical protein
LITYTLRNQFAYKPNPHRNSETHTNNNHSLYYGVNILPHTIVVMFPIHIQVACPTVYIRIYHTIQRFHWSINVKVMIRNRLVHTYMSPPSEHADIYVSMNTLTNSHISSELSGTDTISV